MAWFGVFGGLPGPCSRIRNFLLFWGLVYFFAGVLGLGGLILSFFYSTLQLVCHSL